MADEKVTSQSNEAKNEAKSGPQLKAEQPAKGKTFVEEAPPVTDPSQEATAPVNLGAERITEVAKEIGESSGDPIRDAKLLEVHGSLYDPATSEKDLAGTEMTVNGPVVGRTPDQVVPEATRREMERGRAALQGYRGSVVRPGGVLPNPNVSVPRVNQAQENMRTPGTPVDRK